MMSNINMQAEDPPQYDGELYGDDDEYSQYIRQHPRFPSLSHHRLLSILQHCPKRRQQRSYIHDHDHPHHENQVLILNHSLIPSAPTDPASSSSSAAAAEPGSTSSPHHHHHRLTVSRSFNERASSSPLSRSPSSPVSSGTNSRSTCKACDVIFFPLITKELGAAMHYFNAHIRLLLQVHLASGMKKAMLRLKHKQTRSTLAMVQEGQTLVSYAAMITSTCRSVLQAYDKVHRSCEGTDFRAWLVRTHMELVQSPWLVELLAQYFNLTSEGHNLPEICQGCTCNSENGNLILCCMPHESLKLEIEVLCPICLETLFEPVALSCSHIFCFSCACAAAAVPVFQGLRKAKRTAKCPLCREVGAFTDAVRLTELHLLVRMRCKDYWKTRLLKERKERMQQIKEHWSYRPEDVGSSQFNFVDY